MVFGRFLSPKTRRVIKRVLGVGLIWMGVHLVWITWDGLRGSEPASDIAIVYGNPIPKNGWISPWLQARLDKAVQLYQNGKVHWILASGAPESEKGAAEGDAMKAYLSSKGIDPRLIIADNQGSNTYYTALDFLRIRDSLHVRSALVVTSFYHITRAKYILRKKGFNQVEGAAARRFFFLDLFGMVREFFAFYKYLIWY